MYTLRPYQIECSAAIRAGHKKHRSVLAVAPTGTGKTVTIADHVAGNSGCTLVVAHREELVNQAIEKLELQGIKAAKEKADHVAPLNARVVVASVQTLSRPDRLRRFPSTHFGNVVIDEAHHTPAPTYQALLDHFIDAKVLGVTATPYRGNGEDLSDHFETVFELPILTAMRDGWICPVVFEKLKVNINLSGLTKRAGDFGDNDLAARIEPLLREVARLTKERAGSRKILVFTPTVRLSMLFTELLNAAGITAGHLDGTFNDKDRAKVLSDLKDGTIQAVCNCGVLTEGFDHAEVSCIVMLRPTLLRGFYLQMIGRGFRPAEGKKNLLVIDPTWISDRHDLVGANAIDERLGNDFEGDAEDGIDDAEKKETERDVEEERRKSLAIGIAVAANRRRAAASARGDYTEMIISARIVLGITGERPAPSMRFKAATDKQKAVLVRKGYAANKIQTAWQASELISLLAKTAVLNNGYWPFRTQLDALIQDKMKPEHVPLIEAAMAKEAAVRGGTFDPSADTGGLITSVVVESATPASRAFVRAMLPAAASAKTAVVDVQAQDITFPSDDEPPDDRYFRQEDDDDDDNCPF